MQLREVMAFEVMAFETNVLYGDNLNFTQVYSRSVDLKYCENPII